MSDFRLALAGNPNSGKTTLFNQLTGARQRVGNYPGVTVARKEGVVRLDNKQISLLDLPGCYSLTAYSPEERVARQVLAAERPQTVIQVLDATTLERSLLLTVQLLEMGVPVVLALNMMDETRRKGIRINSAALSRMLGVPVVETVAREGRGKKELLGAAVDNARTTRGNVEPLEISYGHDLEETLRAMALDIETSHFLAGTYPARWVALKYLEGDADIVAQGRLANPELSDSLLAMVGRVRSHLKATLNTHPEAVIADYRYGFINAILQQGVLTRDTRARRMELTHHIDQVLTNRLLGPLIMLAILYGVFWLTFSIGEIPMGWLEALFGRLGAGVDAALPDGLLKSLVVAGAIDGVGGVLGFVPLIVVMFLALTFLEDVGYMARIAFMLDRVLRIFGLHGCSVMPFLVSGGLPGGCAVPGVMATRTLRSPREKLATLLTAPFMTCGAKVPVVILLAAAFFPGMEARVMFLTTLGAWAMALLVSRVLRSTLIRGESTPFIMELPPYRLPTVRGLLIHTWERAWEYIKKAGTIILAISILIWAAMTFPAMPESDRAAFDTMRTTAIMQAQEQGLDGEAMGRAVMDIDNQEAQAALRHSLAGRLGAFFEPVTQAAGFDWRTNIALVGGFAAKEVIVSSLGTAYSLGEVDPEEPENLSGRLAADPGWSMATALALLVFVMLYAPCFVTVVAMARESSWKWAAFATTFNTALAFGMAVGVYQFTRLLL